MGIAVLQDECCSCFSLSSWTCFSCNQARWTNGDMQMSVSGTLPFPLQTSKTWQQGSSQAGKKGEPPPFSAAKKIFDVVIKNSNMLWSLNHFYFFLARTLVHYLSLLMDCCSTSIMYSILLSISSIISPRKMASPCTPVQHTWRICDMCLDINMTTIASKLHKTYMVGKHEGFF